MRKVFTLDARFLLNIFRNACNGFVEFGQLSWLFFNFAVVFGLRLDPCWTTAGLFRSFLSEHGITIGCF